MCPYERLAACVVKVTLHEEIEEVRCVAANGAQLGVAALKDFVAQGGTHVGTAVEEGAGELERQRTEKEHVKSRLCQITCLK